MLAFSDDFALFGFQNLPAVENQGPKIELIDDLIDKLMLDEDEFDPNSTFNPTYQHVYRCIIHRIMNPDADLPSMDMSLNADIDRLESIESTVMELSNLFGIEAGKRRINLVPPRVTMGRVKGVQA